MEAATPSIKRDTNFSPTVGPHYLYHPLQKPDTVRVLELDPGQFDEPLRGSLEEVSVYNLGGYEAISYVWGDSGPRNERYEMIIHAENEEDKLLPLRGGSIFAVLQQIRFADRPRRVWADQCCINQADLVERSNQVHAMGRIYENATNVLVWLGLDTERKAALAFKLVNELSEVLNTNGIMSDCVQSTLERQLYDNHKALKALTDCRWFKRGWVVQEIGTKSPATVMWGDCSIDWDILANVCQKLKGYHQLRSTLGITTSDISFLFQRFIEPDKRTHHANRYNFIYELQRSRHLQFTDQRDRVFAFLSHFSTHSFPPLGCGPVSVVADYTQSVEQAYTDVAMRILRDCPEATCITLAAVQHPPGSLPTRHNGSVDIEVSLQKRLQDKLKLPSWVPDWRWSEGIILAEPICPHFAHGTSTIKANVLQNTTTLLMHGMEIDIVESVSRPLVSSDFYNGKVLDQLFTPIQSLWRTICKKTIFNLKDTYLNGETAFFAFMQTLSNGCVQATGHECKRYDSVPDSMWLQKAARFIVATLGTSDDVAEDIRREAAKSSSEGEHEQWSRWATSASDGRVFARTARGYYVLGPSVLEEGDTICVMLGCKVPFCLRRIGARYVLVGECYVHGLMKGEATEMLNRGQLEEKAFDVV
ncbi:heterokaryon incompatibility protein het-6 [Fusarium heterosporum]|uniref:Heterokaryon incompatibility protein het-6 n=1 Tax=Fusarium heterosporum TaxID=42747 RepID=A0A8H5WXN8_FUSHE|nr:heterokaryon incompatibility protein het-6 [Fusarium heterosporum]